jgi:superfamily I DNA/RNA helicase
MAERKELTPKQREIVAKTGMFVVKACPGSGKTFAVAARFAHLLRDWPDRHRGIAVISFTNVAWQEIERSLTSDFGVKTPIAFPHFLGTIDSFFNQYIFLPFGHLIMQCGRRPELIGPPFNNWDPVQRGQWSVHECNKSCTLNAFSYRIDGTLVDSSPRSHSKNCTQTERQCDLVKKRLVRKGYATQSDARYFAMRAIEQYPSVARALAYRFPQVLMDEAQDSSEIEMRIVDLLVHHGLSELMLIGDPEQAIFEWRDARPDLLESKYTLWQANSVLLDENWRSSQKICNFFHEMSGSPCVPEAVNPQVANLEIDPKIWPYSKDGFEDLVAKFTHLCEASGIALRYDTVGVLARSKDLVKDILGNHQSGRVGEPWRDTNPVVTRTLCEARWRFDHQEYQKAMKVLAKGVCAKQAHLDYCSEDALRLFVDDYGHLEWRKDLYELLVLLPTTDCPLGEWIQKGNEAIKGKWLSKLGELAIKGGENREAYAQMDIDAIFLAPDAPLHSRPYRVGTIHSVKGETIDAVLVALKEKAADNRKYELMLDEAILSNEELRIVYVGITRARRILVLAVPEKSHKAWQTKFFRR